MSLSIQAPITAAPVFPRLKSWVAAILAKRQARRTKAASVKHLRTYDAHLLSDIDLDREALWQPRPEIRALHATYLVASRCRAAEDDEDRRLLV